MLREPGSNRPKICQKSKWSVTIGIDSGGPQQPFDVLVGLFRAIFNDFDQNTPSGDRRGTPFIPLWANGPLLVGGVVGGEAHCARGGIGDFYPLMKNVPWGGCSLVKKMHQG